MDFGVLTPGNASDVYVITIENKGDRPVAVTAKVIDQAQSLFINGLKLDGNSWDSFAAVIGKRGLLESKIRLCVPENYTGFGVKSGNLTFWAEEAP
jgi:hypothetical protein